METSFDYVIVGAGLAGSSAIDGIRQHDATGSVLLIGAEPELPYDRPPLSKQLWFGTKQIEQVYLHDRSYYRAKRVELLLATRITALDRAARELVDHRGRRYGFGKLLLATGGAPRQLPIPGGDDRGLCYFRTLEDFRRLRTQAGPGKSAVVIGGGFIGSELAAGLRTVGTEVTMVFPEPYLAQRVLPPGLGLSLQQLYQRRGVQVFAEDAPVAITRSGERFVTLTGKGARLSSDLVAAGIGIRPSIEMAATAGLVVGDGIRVNGFLQTSDPDIYAAGDNAFFPYVALNKEARVEHWDNAVTQGRLAGENMAGAREPYLHMPFFYSDLFEVGYEAVGEVDSRLECFADWREENRTGTLYYLRDGKVRGVLLCNVWGKVDAARRLIREGKPASPETLRGAIE